LQRNKSFETIEIKAGDDAPEGSLLAVFSTFDVADRDGDIVRASAFKEGQRVPMVWAHDWSKPVGDGTVRVEKGRAVFDGRFWLDTFDGEQAYKRVKNAGDLQEYSWGFRVTDTQPNSKISGYDITGAEVFEVSPVLVGANQHTQTLAVKGAACPTCGHVKADDADVDAKAETDESITPHDDQPDELDWRITTQLAIAAAELEELDGYADAVA
jgi:HK97 family phage prohead protease